MKWITALQLEQWAQTIAARVDFPNMILDLIRASSSDLVSYRFPSGDKGQIRGFDGVLESDEEAPFIPKGRSIWEFGVTEGARGKAEDDYAKRTKEIAREDREKMTFVFATPQTWDLEKKEKLQDWVDAKQKKKEWGDVRYIDGVQVEHWLDDHPAVASRYAREFLKLAPVLGAYSADEFWDEFSLRFEPRLSEDVLLAGRDDQAKSLLTNLSADNGKLAYAADSPDEVTAFVIAAIRKAEPEVRAFLVSRLLVVESQEAVRFLRNRKGLIFLPKGQARAMSGLLANAGTTVISAGADEQKSKHILLNRPTSTALGKALTDMGVAEDGYELARRCGRSLAVLARQIPSGTSEQPEWIEHSAALLPALLAGAWKPGSPDSEVLKLLSAKPSYEEFEAPLRQLTKLKDPPVDRVDDVWTLRSSVDAFVHLAHLIGAEHLTRLEEQAKSVFSKTIPKPKPDEIFKFRPAAEEGYSRWLREGVMTTLLHMASLHEQAGFTVAGSNPRDFVNKVVRSLPGLTDYRFFASFKDNLPLLAEAAPDPFLESLERLLEGAPELIRPIFEERKHFFSSDSDHVGLLFALEVLAWESTRLLRVTRCLAKLAVLDPGGSLSNRPINSLREIFLSWSPNTNATSAQRNGILKRIVDDVPEIAWPLLEKLLPSTGDISHNTQCPRFAEAEPGGGEVLTYALVWASQLQVVKLAVQVASFEPLRWKSIIETLGQLQPDAFDVAMTMLEEVLAEERAQGNSEIWDLLRKESNRHRTYLGSDWALNPEHLSRVESIVENLTPTDPVIISKWLFDDWIPSVPGSDDDADDPLEKVEEARFEAVKLVFQQGGIEGLAKLANTVLQPRQMHGALTKLELSEMDLANAAKAMIQLKGDAASLATLIVANGVSRFGFEFLSNVEVISKSLSLTPDVIARMLLALDDGRETWRKVATFGTDVEEQYWQQKYSPVFDGPADELIELLDRYVHHGRAVVALDVSTRRLGDVPTATILNLLDSSVKEVNANESHLGTMFRYSVERAFKALSARADISEDVLAMKEFAFLPILNAKKSPLVLHRLIAQKPPLFMEAVCAVYKPAGSDSVELPPERIALARASRELLNSLTILPGQVKNDIDFDLLLKWCDEVRSLAAEQNRVVVTDLSIGRLLAHSPPSARDGAWPHDSVRRLIDTLNSADIERGVQTERFNMRGVYSKVVGEGGQQERVIAEQARSWAEVMPEYPRTASMLTALSSNWESRGKEEDLRAEKDALRW